ncbi:MAG: exopolysaccharide biosynthesis protein [Devosia sp.]|nr:exopolysaccharide biosynthesis protein [Devosia sp.]
MNNVMRPRELESAEHIADVLLDERSLASALGQHAAENDNDAFRSTDQAGLALLWQAGRPLDGRPSPGQLRAKRMMDVALAAMALALLLPLLLIVASLVAASGPGPVLFRQQREGLGGRLFGALKFRSMRVASCDPSGVRQTVRNDPRVTPIGAFIRRTSIDELPQLWNVLRGDMSLVGPRPHVPGMYAGNLLYKELVPYYEHRLAMRPGITGWAQANGLRGPTSNPVSARARVDFDLAYIQNFSLWLDCRILFLTIRNEFFTGSGH